MENTHLKIEKNSELVPNNAKIQGLNLNEIGPLCPKCGGIKSKKNTKGKSVSVPNTPLQTNKNILNVNDEKNISNNGAQIFPIEQNNSEEIVKTKLEPQKIIIKQARIKLELKEIDPENEADSEGEEEKNENDFNSMPKGIKKTKSYPEDMTPAWQKYQNLNMDFDEKNEIFEDSKQEIIKQNGEDNTEKCNDEDLIDNSKIDETFETKSIGESEKIMEKNNISPPQAKYLRGDVIFRCQPFSYVIEANFRHRPENLKKV